MDNKGWTRIIKPTRGWWDIDFGELWQYRDLVWMFVVRDFTSRYKQTVLGPLWFLLNPLLTTFMFTLVFSSIAKLPTDGIPPVLFYLLGTVTWNYFSSCLTVTSTTFTANASIYGKVYFPRLVTPISVIITNIITYVIQMILFLSIWLVYFFSGTELKPNLWLLATPILVMQMGFLGLGCGIIVSSLTTKYRDLALLVGFGAQLWMYATPVIYPISMIPQSVAWLMALNPMTAIIELSRYGFLGGQLIPLWYWGVSIVMTLLTLIVGLVLFGRVEKAFMDTI